MTIAAVLRISAAGFLCSVISLTALAADDRKPADADIYIAESPAGAGDGSSAANAKSVSFFNAPANWGTGVAQIGPGTTVHLCGPISTQLTAQGNGASDAPLTILFEPDARISMGASDTNNGCLNVSNRSYVIIDGGKNGIIENTDNGTQLKFHVPSVAIKAMACDHCEFKNLHIANLYVHTDVNDARDLDGDGAILFSGSHIKIHDSVIHDVHWAIKFFYGNGDADVDVYNNDISRTDHGFTVGGWGTTVKASGIKFHNNHIHDYANWDTLKNAYHHDGVHAYATPPAAATDLQIYNNLFDGDTGKSITGHIFIESGTSPWSDNAATSKIFNNVLIGNSVSYTGWLNVGMGTAEVYNNTVISNGTGNGYGINNLVNAHFKNNLAIHCDTFIAAKKITGVVDFDNNCYFQGGVYNAFVWNEKTFTSNLNTWRSACHSDLHSINPAAEPGVDLRTGVPTSKSAVIGAGENLTGAGIAALDLDKGGFPRPKSGPWDVGACQPLVR
ncbi:MAG: hypothetical protein ABSA67_05435 [Candidatus Brocadiia bacterium]|jgi:hypothetical protein